MPDDIFINTPHGVEDSLECQFLMETLRLETRIPRGLQYGPKLDDGSYVTVWQETQDQSVIGIGHQRFDSEGNALASQLIRYDTPRQISGPTWVEDEITLEQSKFQHLLLKGQGLNDFTISLNSTNETFKVSSFGEKSKLYKTESGSYILDYAGNNVGDIPEDLSYLQMK